MTDPTTPRRLDRCALRRAGALSAGTGARADRFAARRQRAACRAHGRAARRLRPAGREARRARGEVRAAGLQSITNLIVRRRYGAGGRTVALNAHGDVVPPGEGWTHDPYGGEIEDGRLYGRAAAVSKSDFSTYTFAMRALEALGAPLAGGVELHFTYDEEFGGELGPGWLLAHGLTRAGPADRRRLRLPGGDRTQRLPAARGDGARPHGACGDPRHAASTRCTARRRSSRAVRREPALRQVSSRCRASPIPTSTSA